MYSQLSLYYLDQLGIKPWVLREGSDASSEHSGKNEQILVLVDSELSKKARRLLNQMLAFISRNQERFNVLCEPERLSSNLTSGMSVINFTEHACSTEAAAKQIHWINCPHPEHLLKHPKEKKTMFLHFSRLKQLVTD